MSTAHGLLNAKDRDRLGKLLALIDSPHPGEAHAAGMAAAKLLKSRGLTWPDVIEPQIEKPLPQLGRWRQTVAQLVEQPRSLRPWERTFLADLPGFRRLSTKQRYCLQTIANRVLGEGVL